MGGWGINREESYALSDSLPKVPGQSERRANLVHLSSTCVKLKIDLFVNLKVCTGHLSRPYTPLGRKGSFTEEERREAEGTDNCVRPHPPSRPARQGSGGTGKEGYRTWAGNGQHYNIDREAGAYQVNIQVHSLR